VGQQYGEFIPELYVHRDRNRPYYIKGHVTKEMANEILVQRCDTEVVSVAHKFARRFAVGPEHASFLDGLESPLRVIDFPRQSYYPVTECVAPVDDRHFDKNGDVRQEWQEGYDDYYAQRSASSRGYPSSRKFGYWVEGWQFARDQATGGSKPSPVVDMRINIEQLIQQVAHDPSNYDGAFAEPDGLAMSSGDLLEGLRAAAVQGHVDLPVR
jgi:hypothetical protein